MLHTCSLCPLLNSQVKCVQWPIKNRDKGGLIFYWKLSFELWGVVFIQQNNEQQRNVSCCLRRFETFFVRLDPFFFFSAVEVFGIRCYWCDLKLLLFFSEEEKHKHGRAAFQACRGWALHTPKIDFGWRTFSQRTKHKPEVAEGSWNHYVDWRARR